MSDFFGNENVEIPATSNYMSFEDGDNRFRILGSFSNKTAIQGLIYWKTIDKQRKPIRVHKDAQVALSELEVNKFGDLDKPKYFWALPVYNYQDKRIQILEITQKTILKYITKVIENPKWGDPREFDFIVNRGKEGDKTVYTVTNDPKESLDPQIEKEYKAMKININALFQGEDPFDINTEEIDVNDVPDFGEEEEEEIEYGLNKSIEMTV